MTFSGHAVHKRLFGRLSNETTVDLMVGLLQGENLHIRDATLPLVAKVLLR